MLPTPTSHPCPCRGASTALGPWSTRKNPSHVAGAACGGSGFRDVLDWSFLLLLLEAKFSMCSREDAGTSWDQDVDHSRMWIMPCWGLGSRFSVIPPAFQTSWSTSLSRSSIALAEHSCPGSLPKVLLCSVGTSMEQIPLFLLGSITRWCWKSRQLLPYPRVASQNQAERGTGSFGSIRRNGECSPEGCELRAPTQTGKKTGRVFEESWNGSRIQAGGVWMGGNPHQGQAGRVKPWWH